MLPHEQSTDPLASGRSNSPSALHAPTPPPLKPDHDLLEHAIGHVFGCIDHDLTSLNRESPSVHFAPVPAPVDTPAPSLSNQDLHIEHSGTMGYPKASPILNSDVGSATALNMDDNCAKCPNDSILAGIAGFEILEEIGRGGMGTVCRAREVATGRFVAIKFLDFGQAGSRIARARFEREIKLAAQLEHAYIARIYTAGIRDGCYYFAMEYVEGLAFDIYCKHNKLNAAEVIEVFIKVCQAMDYAHHRGVVHRDLKPSNILIRHDGEPRIVDFGLAKHYTLDSDISEDEDLSTEGHVAGSPGYMSPEQAAGQVREIDHRSDIYGLGAVLFKALTGEHPHEQKGPLYEVVRRVLIEPVRNPRKLNPRIPRPLETILLTALAKDKYDRYPTAGMLADDLQAFIDHKPIRASGNFSDLVMPSFLTRLANAKWQITAMLLALALIGVLGLYYWEQVEHEDSLEIMRSELADEENAMQQMQREIKLQNQLLQILEEEMRLHRQPSMTNPTGEIPDEDAQSGEPE